MRQQGRGGVGVLEAASSILTHAAATHASPEDPVYPGECHTFPLARLAY